MSQDQLNDLQPSDVPSQDNGHDKAPTLPDPNQNIDARNAAQILKSIEALLQQQNSKLDQIIRHLRPSI